MYAAAAPNACNLCHLDRSVQWTLDELRDTLIQIAVYVGIPAGVEAFRLGREVLDAEGIVPDPAPGS